MISDLTTLDSTLDPGQKTLCPPCLRGELPAPIQPVANVPEYLELRRPQPEIHGEECLLITLPKAVQDNTRALVRACHHALTLVKEQWSVQRACIEVIRNFWRCGWALKTFRAKYDEWDNKKDWVVLVNLSKAPSSWRADNIGLPENFLLYCETKFAKFKRADGKRQALLSIKRNWTTGKDESGHPSSSPVMNSIVGSGRESALTAWPDRDRENFPVGWSYPNLLRQINKRARFSRPIRALLHEGQSAARQFLPTVLGDTRKLRFLEQITFDDVRMDWLVFNTATGEAEELWLLVARDSATRMVLGFVMHPATVREDGTATHLGARQMKELAAYLLETYPLPPYLVHWVVERGTATLAEAVKLALGELFDHRIKIHYTSMIGGKSPVGYQEKAKGNSRGKASHESHNRLFHTQACHLPGQTGARWEIRPADLNSRVEECKETWKLRQRLPEHQRGDERYPLTVLQTAARDVVRQFCLEQNFRTDHALEGFDQILEWWDGRHWQPASNNNHSGKVEWRKRMEMPVEKALRLIREVGHQWTRCSPDIVKSFLEHTQRLVNPSASGEVKITVDGKVLTFAPPSASLCLCGKKALAYFCPDDPQFIHLTTGDGRFLGTWYQRGRVPSLDQKALAEALRYTHAAVAAAQAAAQDLAAPQVAELEALRAHNAALNDFVIVTEVPGPSTLNPQPSTPVAAALAAAPRQIKKQIQAARDAKRAAREALANMAT